MKPPDPFESGIGFHQSASGQAVGLDILFLAPFSEDSFEIVVWTIPSGPGTDRFGDMIWGPLHTKSAQDRMETEIFGIRDSQCRDWRVSERLFDRFSLLSSDVGALASAECAGGGWGRTMRENGVHQKKILRGPTHYIRCRAIGTCICCVNCLVGSRLNRPLLKRGNKEDQYDEEPSVSGMATTERPAVT
jgi:hypothetical protein